MQAIIMAGGEGTRLRPLTCSFPKPMAKIANKPIMEHILNLLSKNGITQAAATLLYLPQVIKDYFGDGSRFGVALSYFEEIKPLGTAGGVKNCSSFIEDTFIVISGDAACSFDLKAALQFHKEKKAQATLILTKVSEPLEYGVVLTGADGKIQRFIEKPSWSRAYSDTINTGIYILEKSCLHLIPEGKSYDFGKDLFPLMLKENMPLYGYEAAGYWCDIGSDEAYLQCNLDALEGKYPCELPATPAVENAVVIPPCVIGENVSIANGAIIGPYAILDKNVVVQEGASIKKSVIYENSFLGGLCEIRGTVLANNCTVKDGARIFEGSIIGERCVIGKNSQIDKGVKLWPCKTVADNIRVTSNVVWGDVKEGLFDDEGITGDTGLEMTPELAAKIGASVCNASNNKTILLANTGGNGALMLSLSLASGALSAGGEVYDLGQCTENIWRFAVNEYGTGAGILIQEVSGKAVIKLCGQNGCIVGRALERKIESAFLKEDSKRQTSGIHMSLSISGIYKLYEAALIRLCGGDLSGIKVLIHCPHKELLTCIENAVVKAKGELSPDGISLFIAPDGMNLSLADEKGNYFSPEYTLAILTNACILMGEKELYVPNNAPVAIDNIAEGHNVKIKRVITDEDEFSANKMHKIFTDGCIGAFTILNALKNTKQPLHKLASSISPFYTVTRFVEAQTSKGLIMRVLSSYDCDSKEYNEGIRLNLLQGNVLITPQKKGKQFIIKSEASRVEVAKELCNGFEDLIKNMKEGD